MVGTPQSSPARPPPKKEARLGTRWAWAPRDARGWGPSQSSWPRRGCRRGSAREHLRLPPRLGPPVGERANLASPLALFVGFFVGFFSKTKLVSAFGKTLSISQNTNFKLSPTALAKHPQNIAKHCFSKNTRKTPQNTKHPQNTRKTPQNTAKHHKTHLLTKQTELANKPLRSRSRGEPHGTWPWRALRAGPVAGSGSHRSNDPSRIGTIQPVPLPHGLAMVRWTDDFIFFSFFADRADGEFCFSGFIT